MTVLELDRNDAAGATQVYRDAILDGTWTPELSSILIMLQDDPTEFLAATDKLEASDPELAARLAILVAATR